MSRLSKPNQAESAPDAELPSVYSFEWFLKQYVESRFPAALRRHLGVSDIVQSIFCVATLRNHQFRGNSEIEFRGWLMRIAERKIMDGLRRYRSRQVPSQLRDQFPSEHLDPLDDRTPPDQLASAEVAKRLLDAIAKLPPDVRAIVELRHIREKTFEEISTELAMPVTTCRRRWLEGLQQIESQLGAMLR